MNLQVAHKRTDCLVPTPIVHQTAFWGRVQRRLGFGIDAFDLLYQRPACIERGDVLVLRAALSDDVEYAYVPFGPELAPTPDDAGPFLERLSRELRPALGARCAFIRWDLPWTSVHAREAGDFTDDGEWRGPPPDRLREIRMNIGTADHSLYKAPRDLLPPDTVLIDLEASEDEILARMHHKTRYNIRLAERRGVTVDEGTVEDLGVWYELYLATAARGGFEPMPIEHFTAMLTERAEGSASPVKTHLLLARHEGRVLAGMLLAIAPKRATYLYGASTRDRRDVMAPYAVQWAAIQLAKVHGCKDYDLFGAAQSAETPHPLAGVHRFKIGFGGRLVHREGCWDFAYDEKLYTAVRSCERAHLVARGIGS